MSIKGTNYWLEFLMFAVSFIICLIPKGIKNVNTLANLFPILIIVSAGILLAVLLLDIIPHIFYNEDLHQPTDDKNATAGMISAAISFLLLTAIDQCVIKHDHCEENDDTEHLHCEDADSEAHGHNHEYHGLEKQVNKINGDIGCCSTTKLKNTKSNTKAIIYLFCISLHSFFEGLAVKKNNKIGVYDIGMFAHKALESFAIGVTLFNSALSFNICILLNIFYSALTPLGIVISQLDILKSEINGVSVAILCNGLALGSLLFIVFMEMIPGAFHKSGNKIYKMLGLTIGFTISAIIIKATHKHSHGSHSHSHGSGGHHH